METPPLSASAQLLQSIFPFSDLDKPTQAALGSILVRENYSAGTILYRCNEPVKALYFILSGQVEIIQPQGEGDDLVSLLGVGDHFGEDVLQGAGIARTQAVCSTG
jgi:CRP-like cAMP-binding protein